MSGLCQVSVRSLALMRPKAAEAGTAEFMTYSRHGLLEFLSGLWRVCDLLKSRLFRLVLPHLMT